MPRGQVKATAVQLRLPPARGDADVILLERFVPQATLETPDALDRFQGTSSWPLAHPILVRAELLALRDGRLRDVADRLLTQVILPELTDENA